MNKLIILTVLVALAASRPHNGKGPGQRDGRGEGKQDWNEFEGQPWQQNNDYRDWQQKVDEDWEDWKDNKDSFWEDNEDWEDKEDWSTQTQDDWEDREDWEDWEEDWSDEEFDDELSEWINNEQFDDEDWSEYDEEDFPEMKFGGLENFIDLDFLNGDNLEEMLEKFLIALVELEGDLSTMSKEESMEKLKFFWEKFQPLLKKVSEENELVQKIVEEFREIKERIGGGGHHGHHGEGEGKGKHHGKGCKHGHGKQNVLPGLFAILGCVGLCCCIKKRGKLRNCKCRRSRNGAQRLESEEEVRDQMQQRPQIIIAQPVNVAPQYQPQQAQIIGSINSSPLIAQPIYARV